MKKNSGKKKSFWNNTKTVKGKALSVWVIVMIIIFMLFTFGVGIYLGKEVFTDKDKEEPSNKNETQEIVDIDENIDFPTDINDIIDDFIPAEDNGCVVCDSEGGLCCPVGPDEATSDECVVCDSEGGLCCPVNQ